MERATLPAGVRITSSTEAMGLNPNLTFNTSKMDRAHRGDLVRFSVRWDKTGEPKAFELLSAIILEILNRGALLKVRILSIPQYTAQHAIEVNDDLAIMATSVFYHEACKDVKIDEKGRVVETERTEAPRQMLEDRALLFESVAPVFGIPYWTRGGETAVLWTRTAQGLLGEITSDPPRRDVLWAPSGQNSDRKLDIVKDPAQSDATEYAEPRKA